PPCSRERYFFSTSLSTIFVRVLKGASRLSAMSLIVTFLFCPMYSIMCNSFSFIPPHILPQSSELLFIAQLTFCRADRKLYLFSSFIFIEIFYPIELMKNNNSSFRITMGIPSFRTEQLSLLGAAISLGGFSFPYFCI